VLSSDETEPLQLRQALTTGAIQSATAGGKKSASRVANQRSSDADPIREAVIGIDKKLPRRLGGPAGRLSFEQSYAALERLISAAAIAADPQIKVRKSTGHPGRANMLWAAGSPSHREGVP
jgi:hypothetical protein